jgi:phosphate transport system substrate-binding protein
MKKFSNKEIDIADASRPMKTIEAHKCDSNGVKFIELPVAYDGIAVVVNPKNTWVDKITTDELKTIWDASSQGKIMTWDQIRSGWPNKPLKLFGPSTDNGTFDYFTEAINGKAQQSRGDYTASANTNTLVEGVANDENALGYFGLAYYNNNKDKLKIVPVVNSKDPNASPVLPSLETVQSGTYKPLSRVLYIYVNTNAYAKKDVKDFLNFYLQDVPKIIQDVGYFPLQSELYPLVQQRLQNGITGSLYTGGEEQGTDLGDLLKGSASAQH